MWWIAVFRIRIFRIMGDLQDWDHAGAWFSPSAPVSGTGTGLSFLSHQGIGGLVVGLDQLTS